MNWHIFEGVATIVCLLFIAFWQGHKISSLKTQIDAQDGILKNVKDFFTIFQMDVVHEYVDLSNATLRMKHQLSIKQIKSEFEVQIVQKSAESEQHLKHLGFMLDFIIELMPYVHPDTRKLIIGKTEHNILTPALNQVAEKSEYYGPSRAIHALLQNIDPAVLQKFRKVT